MSNATTTSGDEHDKVWKRRGLFAAAADLVAAVVAKVTEQQVQAGSDGDVVLGSYNETSVATTIASTIAGNVGLIVQNNGGFGSRGLLAYGSAFGVEAGQTSSSSGAGILGYGGPNGFGVLGESDTIGVYGLSFHRGPAVVGAVIDGSIDNAIAIYGANLSRYVGPGPGAGGFGVYGISSNGHGVVGAAATAGAAGVVGAANGVVGAYAGTFYGPVVVSGDFTVLGAKSAAVPHPDGSHRRLYRVESPESWFEDFGKGQLQNGCADVLIDQDFAAVVDLSDYHVFLTAYSDHDGLHVSRRTAEGFCVQAKGVNGSADFSWRIVAKRKDIPAPRFDIVIVPQEPTLPAIPETPPMAPPPSFTARR